MDTARGRTGELTKAAGFELTCPVNVPQTHTCEWRDEAERLRGEVSGLQEKLTALAGNLEALQRAVFGKRSEKMPPVGKQLCGDKPASPEEALKRRRANKAARAAMPEREVHHAVPAEEKVCPKCGGTESSRGKWRSSMPPGFQLRLRVTCVGSEILQLPIQERMDPLQVHVQVPMDECVPETFHTPEALQEWGRQQAQLCQPVQR